MTVVACLKWVDARPGVDPLTGAVTTDARSSGPSDADRAALEWALRLGEARDEVVLAVTAGGSGADAVLREAVAAGAGRAVRVALDPRSPSAEVAEAIASALDAPSIVVCGAWSLDRGTGSMPAFLAGRLGAAQALGLVTLDLAGRDDLGAERRLDGGRRERLRVPTPAVLSVEGGSARLRRASVAGVLAAGDAVIEVVPTGARTSTGRAFPPSVPYRPRPTELAAPSPALDARHRTLALTGALSPRIPPETVVLEPAAAADRLLAQLRGWGYLSPPTP
jgi:electron transfer flavoprotein beta subunit